MSNFYQGVEALKIMKAKTENKFLNVYNTLNVTAQSDMKVMST